MKAFCVALKLAVAVGVLWGTAPLGCDSSDPPNFDPRNDGGTDPGSDGDADTDGDSDTDSDSDTDDDIDTDSDTDNDIDADTDSDTDADTDGDTDGDSDGDTDTESDSPDCVDQDSDGWCLPWDCDDSDAAFNPDAEDLPGNGADEDCDSMTDEVDDTGGTDDESEGSMGPGTENEYNPGQENSDGVDTDPDGWLVLNTEKFALKYLWVSNSADGTVSKIDTSEVLEVGRYHVGIASDRADPSRTSVDLVGDVFVANRNTNYGNGGAESSLTKIAAANERCMDRDGSGTIETSSGPADIHARSTGGVVPVGQSTDECVVWTRGFGDSDPNGLAGSCHGMRAVAATAETGDNFEYNGHAWVGCWSERTVFKLNGATGDLMESHTLDKCHNYGFLLDAANRLWVSCRDMSGNGTDHEGIAWIETTGSGNEHFMPEDSNINAYGIALDAASNVWITTMGHNRSGWLYRFTPGVLPDLSDGSWHGADLPGADNCRGIAIDDEGYVWIIDTSGDAYVHLVDSSEFPSGNWHLGSWYLGDDDAGGSHHAHWGVGVAVDFDGHVWGISRNAGDPNGFATRLELDRSGAQPVVTNKDIVLVGKEPYVYSDMVGYHLRNFTTTEGWYRQTFEVCPGRSTKWNEIQWEADIPAGTSFIIRARTADYASALSSATWFTVVEVPSDISPKALPATLPEGHFIELEVRLYTQNDNSPKVGAINFDFDCTGIIT